MSIGNEILTLQFGHYSNCIGAHWLNIQEAGFSFNPKFLPEINNDILYQEGATAKEEICYSPRLLLVDFKKSLGHLECIVDLDEISKNVNWDIEKIDNRIEDSKPVLNEYLRDVEASRNNTVPLLKSSYNLDDSVTSWSDYINQPLHSRSINVVNKYHLGVNDDEFNSFSLGVELWNDLYFQDDFIDKIRLYMEECDNLQGFHVLIDAHNGFSGLSSKCLEYIRDEYEKKSIYSVPSYSYNFQQSDGINTRKQDLLYILNVLAGMSQYIEYSDIITPVSLYSNLFKRNKDCRTFQNLNYKSESKYHSSAIIAMVLDTVSLPYRTRDSFSRMDDMIKAITAYGRSVACVSSKFPFPMSKDDKLLNVLEKWDSEWFESLTPEVAIDVDNVSFQMINVRGIDNNSIHRLNYASGDSNPAFSCKTAEEMFNMFFQFSFDFAKTSVKVLNTTVRIPPTYPRIFNEDYNMTYEPDNPWSRLAELRVMASLHSTPDVQNFLQQILHSSHSKMIGTLASNLDIIPTDFVEMQENIERLKSCYNDSSWPL